jgi:glycosyltransferase involved in cell wall biosynthesis
VTATVPRPDQRPATTAEPRRLRIALVEFLPSGGMFQFSFQFAAALAEAGHDVRLITGPEPELVSTSDGLEVCSLLPTWHPNTDATGGIRHPLRRVGRALLLLESWRRVLGHLRRERPDVAQFGELRFLLDAAALLVVARLSGQTAIVDVAHNPLPYDVTSKTQSVQKGGRLTRWLLSRAYQACSVVLVLGEGPKQDLLREFPALRAGRDDGGAGSALVGRSGSKRVTRVEVCGHGDYSSVLGAVQVPPPSAAPPSALLFGAWTKYKNIPLLLDAFELVRAVLPEATLTLAGPVMPDVDLAAITERAAAIGHVDLRPGYVPMAELPRLFGDHRVVMFTYETVNVSGSVHMAYTFGRPVVATRVGSMADVVEDGVTGQLADPTPRSVADAMERLLDAGTADQMGANAARHAEQRASWASVAAKAVAAYIGA